MTTHIRIASAADAAALSRLAAETFPLACPPGTGAADIATFIATNLTEERFAEHLADPARTILLATAGGEARGYSMIVLAEPTDPDVQASVTVHPTVELAKFFLVQGEHGSGLAACLMAASLDLARAGGARGIWLGVSSENPRANRFYERQGFQKVGRKSFQLGEQSFDEDFVRELVFDRTDDRPQVSG